MTRVISSMRIFCGVAAAKPGKSAAFRIDDY